MKNNLNKLTHQKDEHRLSDVEPSNEPMPSAEPRGFRRQVLFNLFTILLIVGALAFPYAIKGAFDGDVIAATKTSGDDAVSDSTASISIDNSSVEATSSADVEVALAETEIDSETEESKLDSDSQTLPSLSGPDSGSRDAYPRISIDSSDIASVGHDPKDNSLYVEFKSGGVYRYADVPAKVYDSLMNAESHGKFFGENIMEAGYEFEKID